MFKRFSQFWTNRVWSWKKESSVNWSCHMIFKFSRCSILNISLESMDAAPEVPHPRPTRRDAVARVSDRVWVFFFSSDSRRCSSIRAESASIRAESGWFGQNRAVSAISGVSAGGRYCRYGRNRPENGRNRPETAEIGLEYGWKIRNLHSSFFFCESRPSMCF